MKNPKVLPGSHIATTNDSYLCFLTQRWKLPGPLLHYSWITIVIA